MLPPTRFSNLLLIWCLRLLIPVENELYTLISFRVIARILKNCLQVNDDYVTLADVNVKLGIPQIVPETFEIGEFLGRSIQPPISIQEPRCPSFAFSLSLEPGFCGKWLRASPATRRPS